MASHGIIAMGGANTAIDYPGIEGLGPVIVTARRQESTRRCSQTAIRSSERQ
jgi:hypothetical protein